MTPEIVYLYLWVLAGKNKISKLIEHNKDYSDNDGQSFIWRYGLNQCYTIGVMRKIIGVGDDKS